MTARKVKSYHDRGALFGCSGGEWWIEPAMFDAPASPVPAEETPGAALISPDSALDTSESQLGIF